LVVNLASSVLGGAAVAIMRRARLLEAATRDCGCRPECGLCGWVCVL